MSEKTSKLIRKSCNKVEKGNEPFIKEIKKKYNKLPSNKKYFFKEIMRQGIINNE